MRYAVVGLVTLLLLASCGSASEGAVAVANAEQSETPVAATPTVTATVIPTAPPVVEEEPSDGDGLFPTVVAVTASSNGGLDWQVNVTLLSEYDSPARYADAWRVLDGDDNELGIRVLGHDHANEQPFTRSTSVDIPADLTTVFIEGRDQLNGWSGERFKLTLTR